MRRKARIGVERRMHGVVRQGEEERLAGLEGVADPGVGLECESLGEKEVLAVILGQAGDGGLRALRILPAEVFHAVRGPLAVARRDTADPIHGSSFASHGYWGSQHGAGRMTGP